MWASVNFDSGASRVMHKEFLNLASKQKEVESAIAFVEMLPNEFVDRRTYNMLTSACVRARDVDNALLAAKLMQKRGFELDLPMYTNLILGASRRLPPCDVTSLLL